MVRMPEAAHFTEVVNDPDRVTTAAAPEARADGLRAAAHRGGLNPSSWDEAMADIASNDRHPSQERLRSDRLYYGTRVLQYSTHGDVNTFMVGFGASALATCSPRVTRLQQTLRGPADAVRGAAGAACLPDECCALNARRHRRETRSSLHGSALTSRGIRGPRWNDIVKRGGRGLMGDRSGARPRQRVSSMWLGGFIPTETHT